MTVPDTTIVHGSCHHDCPDTCVWDVTVEDGRAVKLRGNKDHPTTRGQLCPKVNRLLNRVYHPDRILSPLRRTGAKGTAEFEPITWETALDEIAGRLQSAIDNVGGSGVLQYSFDGTQGVIQKGIMADRFFGQIGATDIGRHLCGVTAWLGAADVSGLPYGIDPEDLQHAKTIILWGTNTYLTNRHLWPFIETASKAGATVITIDPIKTSTASRSDHHIQLRPGTDVALVLAIIHILERDDLLDPEWLTTKTTGWEDLRAAAIATDLQEAAETAGVELATIEWLAHTYATNRPSAIRVLVGPEHRTHGRDIMRAIALLPAVTGAWADQGGGLARSTQVYFETALAYPEPKGPPRRNFNMARLGELLTDPDLDPAIQALIVHNSNPAVICPDQQRIIEGLKRSDLFTVVIEQFMTDTASYADIVLPATTQLEHLDLGIAWGHLYLSLNTPAIEPLGEALPNTEIFRRLAAAMNVDDSSLRDSDETLIRQLLDSDHPWLEGITYEHLATHTWARLNIAPGHRPNIDTRPDTEDGRLHLGTIRYQPGDGQPQSAGHNPAFPLSLISAKEHLKFLNANYSGFPEHLPTEGEPVLRLHPHDAAGRSITNGDRVEVWNDRGRLTLTAQVSDQMQPGLVSVPFGWLNSATPEHRSINALTNPAVPEDDTGSAAFHDTQVEVTRVSDD